MGLSNAERQRRHRERVKATLAGVLLQPSEPLRNDLLETMVEAFAGAHHQSVTEAVGRVDERSLLPAESDWFKMRTYLLTDRRHNGIDEEFFISLARESGRKLGDHIVMTLYRDFLAEEVKRQEPPRPVPTKLGRKAVT